MICICAYIYICTPHPAGGEGGNVVLKTKEALFREDLFKLSVGTPVVYETNARQNAPNQNNKKEQHNLSNYIHILHEGEPDPGVVFLNSLAHGASPPS